jgi:hypothetical protein
MPGLFPLLRPMPQAVCVVQPFFMQPFYERDFGPEVQAPVLRRRVFMAQAISRQNQFPACNALT